MVSLLRLRFLPPGPVKFFAEIVAHKEKAANPVNPGPAEGKFREEKRRTGAAPGTGKPSASGSFQEDPGAARIRHRVGLRDGELAPPHQALEGGAVNPKGLGSTGDVSAVLLEGRLEKLLLQCLEGPLLPLVEGESGVTFPP